MRFPLSVSSVLLRIAQSCAQGNWRLLEKMKDVSEEGGG